MTETADIVAINEQKVVELGSRIRQLERACVQLEVEKLQNEALAIENAMTYFRERMPRLQQAIADARTKLSGMPEK